MPGKGRSNGSVLDAEFEAARYGLMAYVAAADLDDTFHRLRSLEQIAGLDTAMLVRLAALAEALAADKRRRTRPRRADGPAA